MKAQVQVNGAGHSSKKRLGAAPLQALDAVMTTRRYRRGEDICSGGYANDSWYRVLSGAAKRCATLADGRQQIVDLLLPGDIFAWGGDDYQSFSIEAAAEGTVLGCYPQRRVESLARTDPRVARVFGDIAVGTVCRLEAQLLILGRTTALEKIGAFLLALVERQAGQEADGVVLPVSRYDIADYLALSVETVSRSLTGLKERGLISFRGTRSIRIVNRDALENGAIHVRRVSSVVPARGRRQARHDRKTNGPRQALGA